MFIEIARREKFSQAQLDEMHHLRARTFKDRKKWEVSVIDGKECDEYDRLDPHYVMITRRLDNQVIGCWRILETCGPYMLSDTFPELLHGAPPPRDPQVLELSRFVVRAERPGHSAFSQVTLSAIREVVRFAMRRNVHTLLTVTTVGVERLLRRTGMSMQRFGPSLQIGIERTVALAIELNEQTEQALFTPRSVMPGAPGVRPAAAWPTAHMPLSKAG